MSRALVAVVPVRGAFWSGLTAVTWGPFVIDGEAMSMVSVRLLAELDNDVWLPGAPAPLCLPLFTQSLPRKDDAIPIKGECDVLVSFEGVPALRERAISVQVAAQKIAIDPSLQASKPLELVEGQRIVIERDIDLLQRAPGAHRVVPPRPNEVIGWEIDRQSAALGTLGFGVAVRADFREGRRSMVALGPSTLGISLASRTVEITFSGIVVDHSLGLGVDRLLVGVTPPTAAGDEASGLLDAGLARATFAFAANVDDAVQGSRPPELTRDERDVARMAAWDAGPSEPSIDPDEYHAIVSELARRPRAEVLEERGFDEISWGCEEWAVAEIIARASVASASAADGGEDESGASEMDPQLLQWVKASQPSRDGLKVPDIDAYARVTAHLAHRNPAKVLEEAALTPAAFIAIEEHMQEYFDRNELELHRFESLVDKYAPEAARAAEAEQAVLVEDT